MSKQDIKIAQEWLEDCAALAREHDPETGIFANENLAEIFEDLIDYLDAMRQEGE